VPGKAGPAAARKDGPAATRGKKLAAPGRPRHPPPPTPRVRGRAGCGLRLRYRFPRPCTSHRPLRIYPSPRSSGQPPWRQKAGRGLRCLPRRDTSRFVYTVARIPFPSLAWPPESSLSPISYDPGRIALATVEYDDRGRIELYLTPPRLPPGRRGGDRGRTPKRGGREVTILWHRQDPAGRLGDLGARFPTYVEPWNVVAPGALPKRPPARRPRSHLSSIWPSSGRGSPVGELAILPRPLLRPCWARVGPPWTPTFYEATLRPPHVQVPAR